MSKTIGQEAKFKSNFDYFYTLPIDLQAVICTKVTKKLLV